MKRACLFLLMLTVSGFAKSGIIRAQSITPQFELQLFYSDPGGGGNGEKVAFGYDTAAQWITGSNVDTNAAFGEYPVILSSPGGLGSFLEEFEIDSVGDGAFIDIEPKPDSSSFVRKYLFYLTPFQVPAKLSWDRTKIPSIINAITIAPVSTPNVIMAEMTLQDTVAITDNPSDMNYYANWNPAIITLYYNTIPASVTALSSVSSGLLSNLETYPNPMTSGVGNLTFNLSQPAAVTISAYDVAGREMMHFEKAEPAGSIQTDLSTLASVHGAILLRVDAATETEHASQTTMMVRE